MQDQINKLNNLREFEGAHVETSYGRIYVQRTDGDNGAAIASIQLEDFPERDRTVKCMTPREAFERQLAFLKRFLGVDEVEIAQKAEVKNLVYGISRWTNASRSSARHIDDGHGKPLCQDKRKVFCWETDTGEPTCQKCITLAAPKTNLRDLRAKVEQIQSSPRVASVEVGFEYEDGNRRFYSAITRETGFEHKYRVRIEENFEDGRTQIAARCNCIARTKCKHIRRVLELDSTRTVAAHITRQVVANYNYRRAA